MVIENKRWNHLMFDKHFLGTQYIFNNKMHCLFNWCLQHLNSHFMKSICFDTVPFVRVNTMVWFRRIVLRETQWQIDKLIFYLIAKWNSILTTLYGIIGGFQCKILLIDLFERQVICDKLSYNSNFISAHRNYS